MTGLDLAHRRLLPTWGATLVPLLMVNQVGSRGQWVLAWIAVASLLGLVACRLSRAGFLFVPVAAFVAWRLADYDGGAIALYATAPWLLAGSASGYLPVHPGSARGARRIARPSLILTVVLLAGDVVMIVIPEHRAEFAVFLGGLALAALAGVIPGLWTRASDSAEPLVDAIAGAVHRITVVLDRVFGVIGRSVGRVLLLGAFVVVVLIPWMVQRLSFGNSLWAPHRRGSHWVAREADGTRATADLWFLDPGPREAIGRRRMTRAVPTVIGCIPLLVVAVGAYAVGAKAYRHLHPSEVAPSDAPGPNSAATVLAAQPWFDDWARAFGEMRRDNSISQYAGDEYGDKSSRYLNERDGVRRTWRPPVTSCASAPVIWMFGGSTTFGVGQRDDHTIASEITRQAWQHGIIVNVVNYGIPGDVTWIEQRRLERELVRGHGPPDLVIFYDGFNDVRAVSDAYQAGQDVRGKFLSINDRDLLPVVTKLVEVDDDGKRKVEADAIDINKRPVDEAVVADAVSFQYNTTHALTEEFLKGRGIPMVRFFQPSVATRSPHVDGDFPVPVVAARITAKVHARLPADVVDLSGALDDSSAAFFVDDVHTNEAANVPLAQRIWGNLAPVIQSLGPDHQGAGCS